METRSVRKAQATSWEGVAAEATEAAWGVTNSAVVKEAEVVNSGAEEDSEVVARTMALAVVQREQEVVQGEEAVVPGEEAVVQGEQAVVQGEEVEEVEV